MAFFEKIYNFLIDSNYNYDSSKINVNLGNVDLILKPYPEQVFSEDFSDETGFTYDSDLVEWTGTELRQKDLLENASLAAPFTIDQNATSGDGSLVGTLNNGATVASGLLDLRGGSNKYLSYIGTGKINARKGSIRFQYIPNYATNPASDAILFKIADSVGSSNNQLYLYHDTANAFRVTSKTSTGAALQTGQPLGTKVLVQGQIYDISYSWDFTNGRHELFIDEAQQGGTIGTISTQRSDNLTSITFIGIGDASYSDAQYDNVLTFPEVNYLAAPAIPLVIPEYRFAESYVLSPLRAANGSPDGTIQSVEEWTQLPLQDVRFTFNSTTGIAYWYNPVSEAWELSDKSYSQSMDAVTIIAELPHFPFPPASLQFTYGIVFKNSNTLQDSITNLIVQYTHQIYPTDSPIISPVNSTRIWADDLDTFFASITLPVNTSVRFIIIDNGVKKWWNGTAFELSNGTSSESNDYADIGTNLPTLISERRQIGFDAFLISLDGLYSPKLTDVTISYDPAIPDPSKRLVDILGFIENANTGVGGIKIYARPMNGWISNELNGISNSKDFTEIAETTHDGYFSGPIVLQPSDKPEGTKFYWEFEINGKGFYTQIPDQDVVNLNELIKKYI